MQQPGRDVGLQVVVYGSRVAVKSQSNRSRIVVVTTALDRLYMSTLKVAYKLHMSILCRYFNAFMHKYLCSCEENVFWFWTAVCLCTIGEVRYFSSVRCNIHFWLIWCKNYRNRSSTLQKLLQKCSLQGRDYNVQACKKIDFRRKRP